MKALSLLSHASVILALWRLRQKDGLELKARLGYIVPGSLGYRTVRFQRTPNKTKSNTVEGLAQWQGACLVSLHARFGP